MLGRSEESDAIDGLLDFPGYAAAASVCGAEASTSLAPARSSRMTRLWRQGWYTQLQFVGIAATSARTCGECICCTVVMYVLVRLDDRSQAFWGFRLQDFLPYNGRKQNHCMLPSNDWDLSRILYVYEVSAIATQLEDPKPGQPVLKEGQVVQPRCGYLGYLTLFRFLLT